jgi:hypothetical protein
MQRSALYRAAGSQHLMGVPLLSGHAQRYRQSLAAWRWLINDYCNALLRRSVSR